MKILPCQKLRSISGLICFLFQYFMKDIVKVVIHLFNWIFLIKLFSVFTDLFTNKTLCICYCLRLDSFLQKLVYFWKLGIFYSKINLSFRILNLFIWWCHLLLPPNLFKTIKFYRCCICFSFIPQTIIELICFKTIGLSFRINLNRNRIIEAFQISDIEKCKNFWIDSIDLPLSSHHIFKSHSHQAHFLNSDRCQYYGLLNLFWS